MLSGYRRDATVRQRRRRAGANWPDRIEAVSRAGFGATCVLGAGPTAPPAGSPSICRAGRASPSRESQSAGSTWPEPDPASLKGPLLFVDEAQPWGRPYLKAAFGRVEEVAQLPRKRGPLLIEVYALDLLQDPKGDGARPFATAGRSLP